MPTPEDIFPLRVGQVDVGNSLCVGADGDGVLGIILKVVAADADLPQRVEECVNRAVALAGNFCGFEAVVFDEPYKAAVGAEPSSAPSS